MYAIIEDGSRQFKVEEGQEVQIDYRDLPSGQQVTFDRVLALRSEDGFRLGQPVVRARPSRPKSSASPRAPSSPFRSSDAARRCARRTGHRQLYTKVKIQKIALGA